MIIDSEFQSLIPPLSGEELTLLESNVMMDGCRDPLTVWEETGILLDGHNRYAICTTHDIPFDIVTLSLPDRYAATNWIIDNQLGRRNLSPIQASILRGKRYNADKETVTNKLGANQYTQVGDQNDHQPNGRTSDRLAAEWGVSPATVRREGRLADVYDKYEPDVQREIMTGEYTKQAVMEANGDGEALRQSKPHVAHNSGNNEWYTPPAYIDAARIVLGDIDLDPASSELANSHIGAKRIYTAEDDGLAQDWFGRVWLNPPYASHLIGRFAEKLVESVEDGGVPEAIVLVNNATETTWFGHIISVASAITFPSSRVRFWQPDGTPGAPLQGQAVIYIGPYPGTFLEAFSGFGWGATLR